MAADISGKPVKSVYEDRAKIGDHICCISNLGKMKTHYPQRDITKDFRTTLAEIHASWGARSACGVRS